MNNKLTYAMLAVILFGVGVFLSVNLSLRSSQLPKKLSEFQAVFLSDGQVYFGHLKEYNRRFYQLSNIYYLKYGSSLQQDRTQSNVPVEQKLNLIKLGGELHGPEDAMYIVKDKVLFIENLKDSSLVVQAIKKGN